MAIVPQHGRQPGKVGPGLLPNVRYPYGGKELDYSGPYEIFPFDIFTMEWVPANNGQIPESRTAIPAGYEESGQVLYFALAPYQGLEVPGKTAPHLVSDQFAALARLTGAHTRH